MNQVVQSSVLFLEGSVLMQSAQREIILFLTMTILCVVLGAGCVTRTERIYPYERVPEDESVWEELRREFGWSKHHITPQPTEPFYKRAAHGVAETVSGWFSNSDGRLSEQEIAAERQRFDRKRAEALQRLREQQELE
jgi:hypothetical protein